MNADNRISGAGGDIRGYNLFSYCFNNPVNMSDQDGNWPQWFKDAVKWVTHNIIKPIVDVVQENLSKVNLTYSTGVNVSGSPSGWSINTQIGVSVDTKGNVAIQASGAGGLSTGTPSASITRYTSISNAPSVKNLEGDGYQVGGTATIKTEGPKLSVGGDLNLIPNSYTGDTYYGITKNSGIAVGTPGGEVHTEWGSTIEIASFNIFDIGNQIYNNIMEW